MRANRWNICCGSGTSGSGATCARRIPAPRTRRLRADCRTSRRRGAQVPRQAGERAGAAHQDRARRGDGPGDRRGRRRRVRTVRGDARLKRLSTAPGDALAYPPRPRFPEEFRPMATWFTVVAPFLPDIIQMAKPMFTRDKGAEKIPQQIKELQDAATQNADAVKQLAGEMQRTLASLQQGATQL